MVAGVAMAMAMTIALGSAGADPTPVTIGSTTGTPTANLAAAGNNATYYSTSSGTTPAAQVTADGTITGFSINSASAGNKVELRVLRPAANGQFTGAGTSPTETLTGGVSTFTGLSMSVKAGDVLGINNADSALLFDQTATTATTWLWPVSFATDGQTSAPTSDFPGLKLLLSATEQPGSTSTTTTNPTTPTTPSGPITSTNPSSVSTPTSNAKPSLSGVSQSNRAWRRGGNLASIAATAKKGPPTGTQFQLTLNEAAKVTLAFEHKVKVRTKTGKTSFVMKTVGQLTFVGHSGVDRVFFQGRLAPSQRLGTGNWTVVFGASTSAGSAPSVSRHFTILH